MTGPEHYREAEQSLAALSRGLAEPEHLLAEAQVHATLALAAATALGSRERDGDHDPHGMDPADRLAWEDTASAAAPIRDQDDGDPAAGDYDPGPEIDDEGGMSEHRHAWPDERDPFLAAKYDLRPGGGPR